MKFAIAPVTYWDSIGFDTTEWRKSLDGTKAICHLEYAEKLGANLHANPQVQIIDSVDPNLKAILESSEWVIDGTNGDLDSFSFLTKLNQFETKVNDAVAEKVAINEQKVLSVESQLQQTEQTLNGRLDTIIALPEGSTTNDARLEDVKVGADGKVYESPGSAVRTQISELDDDLTGFKNDISTLKKSKNLLNLSDENFRNNHFISPTTGTLNTSDSYDTSGFIPVTLGKKIIKMQGNIAGEMGKGSMRFIAAYDVNGNIMPTAGTSADVFEYVVPAGIKTIRVSYINRSDYTKPMIAQVEPSDSGIPPYEAYFEPYYETKVVTDPTLTIDNVAADAKKVGESFAEVNRNLTPYKNPSEVKKSSTLGANIPLVITDFPEMLKTGQKFSFSAKFDTFSAEDKIEVGFMKSAYATYQSWLEITSDRVKWMLSGTNPILNNLHGLTLSKFVHVTVEVTTDTGQLKIMITTLGGSYNFTQTSDSTRFNAIGALTAKATIDTVDVVLSGTCTQFQCDTWLIGDSYFGSGPTRIGGKLMEWGYSDSVLIDGLGGLNSVQAYGELQKILKYGTPKTLVWYLGMNDNATTVASHFPLVEQLCDQNGIELIFNRIPLVPSRLTENNAVNSYVMASGRRYIDSYSAVGADTSGSWYAGHLNSDGVHPDPLGASALTARMIADVPEILA